MTCPVRIDVSVYALGILEPAERARVVEHLEHCPQCRQALDEVAGLPELLAQVSPAQVAQLAPPAETEAGGPAAEPDDALFSRMLTAASVRRQSRRWRWLAAAVAAVVVLLAGGVTMATWVLTGEDGSPGRVVTATEGAVGARVTLQPSEGGTGLRLELSGVDPWQRCHLVAHGIGGRQEVAASWEVNYTGVVAIEGSTSIATEQLAWLSIRTTDGRTLVTLPLDRRTAD